MPILIQAAMTSAIADGLPSEVVYLPEGEHTITPMVNGKAKQITVRIPADRGEAIAASLQAALVTRQAGNVRPWFDFEHKAGKAAALPTAFRYEAGKGIMASVEWTGAGKAAIEGKDFSYLSPTFLVDADGYPSGLPARGPLAALVNEPAFREIPRIAAKDGGEILTNITNIMSLILAHLGIDTAAEGAEKAAVAKIQATEAELATVKAENATLQSKVTAAEATAKAANDKRLDAKVEAAVAAGKIAPKDEETKKELRDLLEASEALGDKTITNMPVVCAGLDTPLVKSADGKVIDATDKFKGLSGTDLLEAALAEELAASN